MSSFDEALRRREAQQQYAQAEQRSQQDQRLRAAAAAAPRIAQLLHQFSQRLLERGVPAKQVELPAYNFTQKGRAKPRHLDGVTSHGMFGGKKFYSPAGFVLETYYERGNPKYSITGLTLVTPEGHPWKFRSGYSLSDPAEVGYVPVTAESLANGTGFPLGGGGMLGYNLNGEAVASFSGDVSRSQIPLDEHLANCALRLINEISERR